MPLPVNGTAWPPKDLQELTAAFDTWDAWWVGNVDGLNSAYRAGGGKTRPSQHAGGVVGTVSRWFWGRPATDLTAQRHQVHVPVATDLCQAAADLVWSEAPTFTVSDEVTQERLGELVDDGALTTFTSGAEAGAALGGHYLRVTWDTTLRPAPFLTVVHADNALPEFRWGMLTAVTFWTVVKEDGQQVWRHLERHELNENGNGVILHGLYHGTTDDLGVNVPLTEHPSTAGLVTAASPDGTVDTLTPGLAVVYVPHVTPQRRWRKHPVGKNLGRSVLDGVEGLMDNLDEVMTAWMRDIRLAKARIIVAQSLLDDRGPGAGASFDTDREVFAPVNALQTAKDGGLPIEAHQFAIRHEEHRATALHLLEQILRTAGFSPATFGLGADGPAVTATEVKARQQRSFLTRDRMLRTIRPAIADVLEKLLAVDAAVFNTSVKPERPDVQFPDGVQESLLSLAQTASALRVAEAASTKVLVQLLHPEWDDDAITEEVSRIAAERNLPPLADPTNPDITQTDPVPDPTAVS